MVNQYAIWFTILIGALAVAVATAFHVYLWMFGMLALAIKRRGEPVIDVHEIIAMAILTALTVPLFVPLLPLGLTLATNPTLNADALVTGSVRLEIVVHG